MTSSVTNPVKVFALIALGIYVANADDKPGAAVIGFLLMLAAVLFGVRTARNRLPTWAGRTALAVGVGGGIVWAEGFGWRDVVTQTPVTPDTRFNIGTAASAVTAAVAPLGLTKTGADSAAEWSPEHIGEPEEDFPLFTIIRHVIFRPIGLAPAQPLPGDRATFYVPRSDDNPGRGRRLMYMRDLACCTNGLAFYSTPSDLVRFALATDPGSVNGELAGGSVMSLMTRRDSGIVVAVALNVAHANTAALALKVAEVFAERK